MVRSLPQGERRGVRAERSLGRISRQRYHRSILARSEKPLVRFYGPPLFCRSTHLSSILPNRLIPLSASQTRFRVLSTEMFRTTEPGVGILTVSVFSVFRSNATIVPERASS